MYKRQLRALSPSKRAAPNLSRRNVENDENRLSLVEPGEKVTGVEEEKTEVKSVDEDEEPPLSPIVGYDIDSDEGDNGTTESSDTDPETERCLISLNSKLAVDTSVDQIAVTPADPRSARRQRLRKRRLKQLKEKADGDDESPKRQKLMDVQTAKMKDAQSDVPTPAAEPPTFVQPGPVTPNNGKLDFKTASGKEVVVSEEALKMAHRTYAEIVETLDVNAMGLTIKSTSATSSFSRPSTFSSSSFSSASVSFRPPSVPTANVPQKSTPASTLERAATTERTEQPAQGGMTQDILECIEACLADDDEGGF